jgi:F-type H+-transporting ATPase subunit gamma
MATGKELKRRIKSIKSTKKITKAMELVAASKMRRAIGATLASRPYASYSWDMLQSLSQIKAEASHPLLEVREANRILVVLITSNRSLCGAYNAQILRETIKFIREEKDKVTELSFITIGRRGEASMRRLGQNVIASFADLPDNPRLQNIVPIANLVIDMFKKKDTDRVYVAYTDFVSALTQKPNYRRVLPLEKPLDGGVSAEKPVSEYLFEPNYEILMPLLVEKLARMQLFQMLLESRASEESSRMLAMKNASDAAGEMIDDLTLEFNKARQASITQEISEISAGMASVS